MVFAIRVPAGGKQNLELLKSEYFPSPVRRTRSTAVNEITMQKSCVYNIVCLHQKSFTVILISDITQFRFSLTRA